MKSKIRVLRGYSRYVGVKAGTRPATADGRERRFTGVIRKFCRGIVHFDGSGVSRSDGYGPMAERSLALIANSKQWTAPYSGCAGSVRSRQGASKVLLNFGNSRQARQSARSFQISYAAMIVGSLILVASHPLDGGVGQGPAKRGEIVSLKSDSNSLIRYRLL
jgi:hypothetical protein